MRKLRITMFLESAEYGKEYFTPYTLGAFGRLSNTAAAKTAEDGIVRTIGIEIEPVDAKVRT